MLSPEKKLPHSLNSGNVDAEIIAAFTEGAETYLTGQLKELEALEKLYRRGCEELGISATPSPKQNLKTKRRERSEHTLNDLLEAQEALKHSKEKSPPLSSSTSVNPLTPRADTTKEGYFEFHQSYEKESLETLTNLASQGSSTTEIALIQKILIDWTQEPKNYLLFVTMITDYFLKEIGYHVTPINCAKAIFDNNPIENRQRSLESLNKTLLTGILYFKKRKAEIEALSKNTSCNANLSPSNSDTISLSPSNSEQRIEPFSMLTCTELCEKTGIDKKPLGVLISLAAEYSNEEMSSLLYKLIGGWDNKQDYLKTINLITKDRFPEGENEFTLDAQFIFKDSTSENDKAERLDRLSKRVVIDLLHDIYGAAFLTDNSVSDDFNFQEKTPKSNSTSKKSSEKASEVKFMEPIKASRNIHHFMSPTAASLRRTKTKTQANFMLTKKSWK